MNAADTAPAPAPAPENIFNSARQTAASLWLLDAGCHLAIWLGVAASFSPAALSAARFLSHDDPANYELNGAPYSGSRHWQL